MKNISMIIVLLILASVEVFAISFGDWAIIEGLTGSETFIDASSKESAFAFLKR